MSGNLNLFEWVRDSVRRSVLLGFSDAVEQIGLPSTEDEIHPNVASLLQVGDASGKAPVKKTRGGGRKRLGKTLKEMNATE